MYSTSADFKAALLASSQLVVTQVEASDGTVLAFSGGKVDMDSTRDIGRTASLELTPTGDLTSDQIYALVRTPGLELTIKRGLIVNGTAEYVPLGVFSTDEASQSKVKSSTVKWSGSDRSKKIARNRFLDPYQILAGTSLATAGTALLQSRLSGVACDFSNVNDTVGVTITFDAGAESNPWKSARNLFSDYGYYLYFDGLGTARAIPIPDPATQAAAFDFGSGETSLVTDGSSKASLENVYNGVIATGEGSDVPVPVRAEVWDTDPNSPTYYLSGFGKVPYFLTSPLLTTVDQCTKAATTALARVKGRFEQLAWPALVNPALEPLDVVTVTFWETTTTCVLDSLTIPLETSGTMTANARATSIV